MASKSLHESSSLTESVKPEKVSNLQRQAKSHYTVKVGGQKNYADSDFVKPHESHAHLNLSHVLIADEPESEILSSEFTEQTSVSETIIHKGTTLPSSDSNSGDEETIITQTDSENPILEFKKDDQGDKAAKFPTSTTDEVTTSLSNTSIDTNHSDTVGTTSWSSISSIEENLPLPDDNPPPAASAPEQNKPPEAEPESRSPARNIFALFRTGLMAARRGAVMEPREKPEGEVSDSSSGDDVDSISSAVQDKGDVEVKKSAEAVSDDVAAAAADNLAAAVAEDAVAAVADEVKESAKDKDASVLVDGRGIEESPKQKSSAEMQRVQSGDIMDDIKEAMLVQQGSDTGVVGINNEDSKQLGEDGVNTSQLGDSAKSSEVTLSEFETVTEDQSGFEDLDGFVTAEVLPDVTQEEAILESETDNLQASYADVVKGMVTQQTEDQDRQETSETQDSQGMQDIVQDRCKLVPPTESIQSRGFTKSDSSVEVIPDVKAVRKETSSLDGLAIAEERESQERNDMQPDKDDEISEVSQLKNELKSSQEECLTLRKQLDVQVMCEEYVRNEAKEEIEKARSKISRLQAQLDKPPKLIHKHRKELRRIFDEIQSDGGPSNLGTTTEGFQHAIRHLYWQKKDVAMLLHETEQRLQLLQTECEAWKRRSKEQEAAKNQLMADYEEQQSSKTKISWNISHSKSDTCLSFRDMKMIQGDIPDNASEQCMSKQNMADMVENLKSENYKLKRKLLDIQSEAQKQKLDVTEVKSQADLLKSKLDLMNDELIQERLHSQHLLTKLHSHELTTKNSKLLPLFEKLDEVGQPIEEAVSSKTGLCDVDGLEDWLGHLKAGQQQIRTELDRYKDKVQDLQNEMNTANQQNNHTNEPSTSTAEQNAATDDQNVKAINEVKELKLWQELHQLRNVQLETVKDLEDKENKINELERRYSELLAEQLQQRTRLELDMEDNRSEKQQVQDQLEGMQQLVSELHRKCQQLSQALEEAEGRLVNQDKTIQDLKDQFAVAISTKEEEYTKKDADNKRQRQLLESRLEQLEVDTRAMALSEKTLRVQLTTLMEENRLLHKQKSKSSVNDEKLDSIHNELAEIREAEEQFRGKYNLQDKEIHHLHNHVNALQTGMRQQVQETINSALSGWKKDKVMLETQLTKALTALDNSEQTRKATEDVNKILIKNANDLEESCKTLTQQLEMQHVGHQKTVDKLQYMKEVLNGEDRNKIQPEQDHDDLLDWEHQLKEEAHRLSTQLHRIMGTHDAQVKAMREANARLVNSLNMSPQTMHSYHDSVSSARAKLQLLLNSTRPKSAVPRLHHYDYASGASLPHRNPYTQAQGLTTNLDETRTMSGPFLRSRNPAMMSSYAESTPLLSFMNGQH